MNNKIRNEFKELTKDMTCSELIDIFSHSSFTDASVSAWVVSQYLKNNSFKPSHYKNNNPEHVGIQDKLYQTANYFCVTYECVRTWYYYYIIKLGWN